MSLLDFDDHYTPPFKPQRRMPPASQDNFEALQNFGHAKMSEDYSDHPHFKHEEKEKTEQD